MDITPLTSAVNGGAAQAGDTVQDILSEAPAANLPDIDIAALPPLPDGPVFPQAPALPSVEVSTPPSGSLSVAPVMAAAPTPLPSDQTLEELERAVADTGGEVAELPELPSIEGGVVESLESLEAPSDAAPKDKPAVSSLNDRVKMSDDDKSDLDAIKEAALKDLAPIVSKLDQPPEEKFNTMVMLLQSSDDKQLVKPAYEAARGIEDEAKRAQALLDVVNEVNYLEHKKA